MDWQAAFVKVADAFRDFAASLGQCSHVAAHTGRGWGKRAQAELTRLELRARGFEERRLRDGVSAWRKVAPRSSRQARRTRAAYQRALAKLGL